jgi:hypothetical protein
MIKRFDTLEITTADLNDAVAIYERNFDFRVRKNGDEATIDIGDAQIRLKSGNAVVDAIKSLGEGLAAIWLETDDLDSLADRMRAANFKVGQIQVAGDRRILSVDPASANMVPLYLFERR